MPIVYDFQCAVQHYRDHFEELDIPRPQVCPHCKAVGTLIGHGSYPRLTARFHLPPFDLAETIGYVRHHVQVAGFGGGTLFTDDAISRVFEYTKGLPRRINQLCTTALMAGAIDKKSVIDEASVRKAIADLECE